ncbi:MAG: PAS domain S-box protein [Alphaproteobacteria bacterium]|nr:PAS domain S-box protein [Alphaproteobacteria bacterium]
MTTSLLTGEVAFSILLLVAAAVLCVVAVILLCLVLHRRSAALTREAQALRQSERYLRDILDNARDAYVAIDTHGCIVEWNAEATRVFGWSRLEVIGRSFASVILAEADRATLRSQIRTYLDTGSADALDKRHELWATRNDGSEITVEMTLTAASLHGEVTFHAFLHNISAHKAAEHELMVAKEMAESSNRAKSQFLAHMSHELRTPLNAIIGFSEIIRDRVLGPIDDSIYRNYAGDIHSSGQHLLEVINDILDLSKAEGGYLEIDARPFYVPDMLTRCADTMRELARKANVEIEVTDIEGLPPLVGEERRIRQIVINLLSNAVKFTPAGGRVTLRTAFSAEGDLQIMVEDTGIGMTPKQVEVALTPFGQIENHLSRRFEGAGLGLPLAKRFAEIHDGTLVVDSTPNAGTRVTVSFPRSRLRMVRLLAKTA